MFKKKNHNHQDVFNSISQQKPVYITGCRNKIIFPGIGINCHAWVVDGVDNVQTTTYYRIEWQNSSFEYETDYMRYNYHGSARQLYHVNWGWGSSYNGWFIDLHNAPVADRNYKYSQDNIYFTKP